MLPSILCWANCYTNCALRHLTGSRDCLYLASSIIPMSPTAPSPVSSSAAQPSRLLSLDFMRGLIMVLLVLESTGLYEHLLEATKETPLASVLIQFFHHPWNGLR